MLSWFQDARLALEFGHRIDATNLHEMAHTYFGDVIVMEDFLHATIKVWLERDVWLLVGLRGSMESMCG